MNSRNKKTLANPAQTYSIILHGVSRTHLGNSLSVQSKHNPANWLVSMLNVKEDLFVGELADFTCWVDVEAGKEAR